MKIEKVAILNVDDLKETCISDDIVDAGIEKVLIEVSDEDKPYDEAIFQKAKAIKESLGNNALVIIKLPRKAWCDEKNSGIQNALASGVKTLV